MPTDRFGGTIIEDRFGGIPIQEDPVKPVAPEKPFPIGAMAELEFGGGFPSGQAPSPSEMKEQGSKPFVPIPGFTIQPQESPLTAAPKALFNVAKSVPEFLESPLGIFSAETGAIAPTAVKGGFVADMLNQLRQSVPDLVKNWSKLTPAQKTEALINVGATGLFVAGLSKSAIRDIRPKVIEKPVEPPVEPPLKPEPIPTPEPPATPAAEPKGVQDASSIEKAAEVHGDVRPLVEPTGGVPVEKGGEGVQPQAEGGIQEKTLSDTGARDKVLTEEKPDHWAVFQNDEPVGAFKNKAQANLFANNITGGEVRPVKVSDVPPEEIKSAAAEPGKIVKIPEKPDVESIQNAVSRAGQIAKRKDIPSSEKQTLGPLIEAARQGDLPALEKEIERISTKFPRKVERKQISRLFDRETQAVGTDILDWISDNMRLRSKSAAKKAMGERFAATAGEWDDAPRLPVHHNARVYGGTSNPDEVAQRAYEAGILKTPDYRDLWEAMRQASARRLNVLKKEGTVAKGLQADIEFLEKATTPDEGTIEQPASDLQPGDSFEIEGTPIEVTKVETDGTVVLKDGSRWGTQTIKPGETIYVEKFEPSKAEPFQLAKPESIEEQKARLAKESEAKAIKEAKAAAEEKAATPLTGGTGDLGQGGLFAPEDLFAPPSPKPIGMGGAVPEEFARTGSPTANKNAVIDAEAVRRGQQPLLKAARFSNQQAFDEAMGRIDRDPELPNRLVQELLEKPRVIDPVEHMVLLRHRVDLRYEYHKAAREAAQAFDDGRREDMAEAEVRTNEWSDRLTDLDRAVGRGGAGTEAGRALQVRRAMMNEDYSLASLELQKRADNGFRPLTPDERAELVKVAADYKAKSEALEAHLATKDAKIAELEAQRAIDKIKSESKRLPYDKRVLDYAESIVVKMEDAAKSASDRLKERLARMSVGVDPLIIKDAAIVGSAKIARLSLDFARFTDEMVKEYSDKIRPFIQQIWDESNKLLEDTLKPIPDRVKKAIRAKMPLAERKTTSEGQIQERIAAGKIKEITPLIQKYARILVEEGVEDRNELIDKVHALVGKLDPKFTRRMTMDAISGYGDFKQLTKDQISVKLRDLKGQMQQVAKLEDMQAGKPPIKTGLERRTPTAEESRLIKQVNEMKREFQIPITDPNTQLKSSLDTLKARMRSRITELQDKLKKGEFEKRQQRPIRLDSTAERLKADLGRVTKEWERAREQDRLNRRKTWQKRLDGFVKWERAFKLSSPVVFGKLSAAALTRLVTTTAEEAVGGVFSKALPTLASKAAREGGVSPTGMAKAFRAIWSKGMDDAAKTAKTGAADIDVAYGDKVMDKDWANFFGRLHGMMKAPIKRAEFELSLEKRTAAALRNGLDVTDPMIDARLHAEALDDAYRSIFMQRGFSADLFNLMVSISERSKKYQPTGEIFARFSRFMLPVVRVPINIVAETATGVHGTFTASARLLWHAMHEGTANIDPVVADSIMRQFKKGSIGLGLMAIGFMNPENIGGYDWREKRKPEDPKAGGFKIFGMNVPRWMTHAPWFELMQFGATIRRTMDKHIGKTGEKITGVGIGMKAAMLGLIEETPFVGNMLRADKMFQSQSEWNRYWAELAKGTLVPQAVQWAAGQLDKPTPFSPTQDPTKRKPKTFGEHIEMGIPGLRQKVPEGKQSQYMSK